MSDRRLTPANTRVAHVSLKGSIDGLTFVEGEMKTVVVPIADIRQGPNGALDRQMLFGDGFRVLEMDAGDGYCFGQAEDGDYVGYVRQSELDTVMVPSHIVCSLGAQTYPEPTLKTVPLATLPFGAFLSVVGAENGYCRLADGSFIPLQQVAPIGRNFPDFITVAESMLRVPYLWGGDSNQGLDCSALVHIALRAQNIPSPRDSDLQAADLGDELPLDSELQRGDLVFWKGHVGIMQDTTQIIHANAHFMAVTSEPLSDVCKRSIVAGDGPITTKRRLFDSAD